MYSYPPNGQQPQYAAHPQQPQYPSQYPPQYPQNGGWYPPMPTANATVPQRQKSGKRSNGKSGSGRSQRPRRRKSCMWQLVKLLLVLVVLAGLGAWAYVSKIQADVKPYVGVFLDNIAVDGINLSGMTWEEGASAVWAQANVKSASWYVRLKNEAGEYNDITAQTLGISFDPSLALEQAWAIGHETSATNRKTIFELKEEIDRMKARGPDNVEAFYSAETGADTSHIDSILQTLEQRAYVEPQDATYAGRFNPDDTANPFTFQSEREGRRLDTAPIKEQILELVHTLQSGEVLLKTEPIPPQVTVADLQKSVSLRFRATTPIDKHSTPERNNNIRIAFSKINGLEVGNGSRLSFNKVVGRRTKKNGFFEAFEYNYGELVLGVGGGVCQASTTLYLAAIQSGMTIVSRSPHGTPVNYTQPGLDATVSDTPGHEVDLVFRNDTGGSIYLAAHVIEDSSNKNRLLCEVRIYGPSMENTRYQLKTVEAEKLPKPEEVEYVQDKKGEYTSYDKPEVTLSEATEGSVIDTYLLTIVDGVLVDGDQKAFSRDTYPSRKAKVAVWAVP